MFQRTKICTGLLIAIGSGSFAMTGSAFAQDTTGVQRVEIIGSSIKRVDTESDAPITTISREEIAKTGATSVEELLRSVTAAQSGGSTAAASASGATTGGISTVSLRGLGPSRTLVLVNGLRSAPYGSPSDSIAVDIDSIPVAAIERIEILKEGAGAIYGSDAVAGVINFVLRKNYTGTEVNAYAGTSYDAKASVFKASLMQGFDLGGKGNATIIVTGEHDSPLYGKDRGFADTSIFPAHDQNGASSNSFPGNITIPGVKGTFNPALPVDPITHRALPSDTAADCGPNSTFIPQFSEPAGTKPGAKCLFDPAPFVSLEPDIKKVGILFNGSYNVSDSMTLHADASITNKKQFTSIQPAPVTSTTYPPLTTANPFYPTAFVTGLTGGATPALAVSFRPFITGDRALTDTSTNERFAFGVDGNLGGWDYSGNLLYSASQVNESLVSGFYRQNGSASTGPGLVPLLGGQDKDAAGNTLWVNPFGANSDAVVAAAHAANFTGSAFRTSTSLQDAQFKVSRDDLFKLPGGGVGVAFGAEARKDGYELSSAPALASGDLAGYGGSFSPINKSRNVYSLFSELDVPVIKDLNIDAAVRYDRYGSTTNPNVAADATNTLNTQISALDANNNLLTLAPGDVANLANQSVTNAGSFGHTTGKIGAKWELNKQFLFRGTYSTGFRAPSLLELYGPLASGLTAVINDPKRCNAEGGSGADCATQFNTINGGNGALKPERSSTWTLGTVLEPIKDVSFALDYFHTKLKDEISSLDPNYILSHEAQYGSLVYRDPRTAGEFPPGGPDTVGTGGEIIAVDQREQNIGEAIVAGLDFDLHGTTKLSVGTFGLGIGGTWQTKWDNVNPDGSHSSQIAQTSSSAVGFTPRVKLTTEGSYRTPDGKLEFTGIYNWQSGAHDVCGGNDQDDFGNCATGFSPPKVKSYGTADFQVKWDPTKMFSGALGVKDAFQAKVPYVNGSGGAF